MHMEIPNLLVKIQMLLMIQMEKDALFVNSSMDAMHKEAVNTMTLALAILLIKEILANV